MTDNDTPEIVWTPSAFLANVGEYEIVTSPGKYVVINYFGEGAAHDPAAIRRLAEALIQAANIAEGEPAIAKQASFKVGDVVHTLDVLKVLPTGTTLRDEDDDVWKIHPNATIRMVISGPISDVISDEYFPFTIIALPDGAGR